MLRCGVAGVDKGEDWFGWKISFHREAAGETREARENGSRFTCRRGRRLAKLGVGQGEADYGF